MPNDVYARKVVDELITPHPPKWLWKGTMATRVWFLSSFFPKGVWVGYLHRFKNRFELCGRTFYSQSGGVSIKWLHCGKNDRLEFDPNSLVYEYSN